MSIQRDALHKLLNQWTDAGQFQDYCPNGLQVEGRSHIQKIVTGVTASQALIDQALARNADAILVHHGYFWKGESASVTGMKKRRLQALLGADVSLFAYHLPLDCHPDFGNNAELARRLGLTELSPADQAPPGILMLGDVTGEVTLNAFVEQLESAVERSLIARVDGGEHAVRRVAICTGGGQGFIEAAVEAGADTFISGEISEQTVHVARERGIHYLAAGHHATERYGVKALGEKLAREANLDVEFIDIDSPA
ncbi:Nif3-like dinuclear metal center hexameric protein [Aliidiomarina sedimenti]|uniref:Nif3-like dinuclear metal center hexameric protein n=1 Tax=Aliidiomarina sedimenti TaxID=1933879 RepID=A0ABY0C2H5_9GAMM|nr:Nif3-like dinuclear metal center hexameric protein [Aliidiomarina sedimenti]RUO31690.1 Nif3-like dinuclear metal center hexameric protein [Aliidiomarina sedimenti]